MMSRVGGYLRRLRNGFDRAYWALRVLPLAKDGESPDTPGLILIQIDGLSQIQFQRALAQNRLPFLRRLIKREKYVQYAHYSGVPSTTPAVQGELFYGVKACVPAFHFLDRTSGGVFVMYDPKCASEIERRLAASGNTPLLEGGSSYSNIFCGGAAESHFCAAGIGWKTLFKTMNPMSWPLLIIFHGDIFIRTFFLTALEFFISLIEGVRGACAGKGWAVEMKFVLMRMVACVYLRELTVLGGRIDIARGLPVVHLNFFGYDEQSHRRGPSSEFAHWTLRGIDSAIARVYRQAVSAHRRDYDLWLYSDHGQERTLPYPDRYGRKIDEAVSEIFGESAPKEGDKPRVLVTGMGPLAHIYPPVELTEAETSQRVRDLIEKANAPMVLVPVRGDPGRHVRVYTRAGEYSLPEDAASVLADDHPFLEEAAKDLTELCHHPNAAPIILSGWVKGEPPMTFPVENGSHAGFGPNETHGFALLPADAPLKRRGRYLRPGDIRDAALHFLGRPADKIFAQKEPSDPNPPASPAPLPSPALPELKVRVMTYNVHGCLGMDKRLSPDRIARVIARHDPDIVALQELDVCRNRSGGKDQAKIIAEKLKMNFHFHAAWCVRDEKYGNAIFSRYPMRLVRAAPLPATKGFGAEPRGVLWTEIDVRGRKVQFFNTHFSIWPREGLLQALALQGGEWLQSPDCGSPVVLCGDFNAMPNSRPFRTLCRSLRDVQLELEGHRPHKTLPAFYPVSRIDHVFIGPGVRALAADAPRTRLERIASDHLPLVVEIELIPARSSAGPGPG